MRLVDGDNPSIDSQDDPDIDFRDAIRLLGEMMHDASLHLFGASRVEAEIALGAAAELLLMVDTAVNTVRMRPEVQHSSAGDCMEVVEQGVECCSAVGFPGEQVNTARWTDDVFLGEETALISNHVDLSCNDIVNSSVIARKDRVPFLERRHLAIQHSLGSRLWVGLVRSEEFDDLVTKSFLGSLS